MNEIAELANAIRLAHLTHKRTILVGISGIDGSGKTYVTERLAHSLNAMSVNSAVIQLDPWRTAPEVRFTAANSAENFYRNAYRFDELFAQLIEPLRKDGRIALNANLLERDGSTVTRHYDFQNVQVILLEGILLFKRTMQSRFDLRIWIDCAFETALKRALSRNQEGVPMQQLRSDYERIYIPSQQLHIRADQPDMTAHIRFENETI